MQRILVRMGVAAAVTIGLAGCGSSPSAPSDPQPPPPPAGTFIENAGARLSYVVDRPAGGGPFPAVVLGHERGPITKAQLAFLSGQLVQAGYIVLRYDRRGTGQSTGTFEDITLDNGDRVVAALASDLAAAVQTLKQQSGVNPASMGLVGPSEAGWAMPVAATMSADVRFVAAIVSPTVPVGVRNRFAELAGDPSRSIDALSTLLAAFGGPFGYDPRPALAAMTVPSFWFFATDDRIVPTRESIAVLESVRGAGRPVTIVERPGTHDIRQTTGFVADLTAWMATVR